MIIITAYFICLNSDYELTEEIESSFKYNTIYFSINCKCHQLYAYTTKKKYKNRFISERKKIFVVKKVKVTKEELDILDREYAEYALDVFWYYTDKEKAQILTTNNEFDFCTLGWADHVFTEEFIGGLSDRRIKILNDKYVKALRKLGLDTLVILAEEQVLTTSPEEDDFDEYFDNLVSYGSVAGPGFHIDIEYSFEITAKSLNVFTHFFKSLF